MRPRRGENHRERYRDQKQQECARGRTRPREGAEGVVGELEGHREAEAVVQRLADEPEALRVELLRPERRQQIREEHHEEEQEEHPADRQPPTPDDPRDDRRNEEQGEKQQDLLVHGAYSSSVARKKEGHTALTRAPRSPLSLEPFKPPARRDATDALETPRRNAPDSFRCEAGRDSADSFCHVRRNAANSFETPRRDALDPFGSEAGGIPRTPSAMFGGYRELLRDARAGYREFPRDAQEEFRGRLPPCSAEYRELLRDGRAGYRRMPSAISEPMGMTSFCCSRLELRVNPRSPRRGGRERAAKAC